MFLLGREPIHFCFNVKLNSNNLFGGFMKGFRYLTVILSIFIISMMMQACGGGSGKETNGSLTISSPTVTGPTGGVYTISETVTYTPPSGKVPNAVPVVITIGGVSTTYYLDSTGSFILTDIVLQTAGSTVYTVSATTGDLVSSVATVLAGSTPLNATPSPIVFASTDAGGTVKTSTIAGGLTPYAMTANANVDLIATISGSTLSVTKVSLTGAVQKNGTITVTDAAKSTISIIVFYY
jgi:hypothetical protein